MRDALSYETCTLSRSGRVRPNPSAGEIRVIELGGSWMEKWNDLVQKETDKSTIVFYEKKIFGLARQTAAGLMQIGVKYEMTNLAGMIKDAMKYKAEGLPKKCSEKRKKELELAGAVLDAIIAYDLFKVAELLEVTPKQPKTFGNDATKR